MASERPWSPLLGRGRGPCQYYFAVALIQSIPIIADIFCSAPFQIHLQFLLYLLENIKVSSETLFLLVHTLRKTDKTLHIRTHTYKYTYTLELLFFQLQTSARKWDKESGFEVVLIFLEVCFIFPRKWQTIPKRKLPSTIVLPQRPQ
jgi:hypothetical protein